jgi:hypothetical protein
LVKTDELEGAVKRKSKELKRKEEAIRDLISEQKRI